MAFKRKDVKKSSYYVWFLGAKESKGIRGDEYVFPVLHYLLDKEREYEPSKVTLQVSSKGLKIIQNVPKNKHLIPPNFIQNAHPQKAPNSQSFHPQDLHRHPDSLKCRENPRSPSVQSCTTRGSGSGQGIPIKMEVIKHLIPSTAITCVAQEDDIVCVILLLFNPITKCPIHVHAYRCDSVETATALKGQLNVLINRPENQKKFAEIEEKFNARKLAHAQMMNSKSSTNQHHRNLMNGNKNVMNGNKNVMNGKSNSINHYGGSDGIISPASSASPQRRSHSDGRSIRTNESDDSFDSFPLRRMSQASPIRGSVYPCGQCPASSSDHLYQDQCSNKYHDKYQDDKNDEKLLRRRNSSSCPPVSGKVSKSSNPKGHPHSIIDPLLDPKAAIFESLAHELKVKLENKKKVGPILLPPRDYDTIHRTRGNLVGIDERKSTNKLLVGQVVDRSTINDKTLINDRTQIIKSHLNESHLNTSSGHKIDDRIEGKDNEYQTRSESSGMSSGIGSDEAIHNSMTKSMSKSSSEKHRSIGNEKMIPQKIESASEEEEDEDDLDDSVSQWLSPDSQLLDIYGSHHREDIEPDYDEEEEQPKYYYFPDPRFSADQDVSKNVSKTSRSLNSNGNSIKSSQDKFIDKYKDNYQGNDREKNKDKYKDNYQDRYQDSKRRTSGYFGLMDTCCTSTSNRSYSPSHHHSQPVPSSSRHAAFLGH